VVKKLGLDIDQTTSLPAGSVLSVTSKTSMPGTVSQVTVGRPLVVPVGPVMAKSK